MAEPVTPKILTIWRLVDGKVGHEKQSQALVELLSSQRKVVCVDIPVKCTLLHYFASWVLKRIPKSAQQSNTKPDLVIGTGHRTHWLLLAIKRYFQCKALVIMSPSLPTFLFDVIVAPKHDYRNVTPPQNAVITTTALAPQVASTPIKNQGLILVGGESKHYHWNDNTVAESIHRMISAQPEDIHWQLSNSRRTPRNTLKTIKERCKDHNNLTLFDYKELDQDWLEKSLTTAGNVWITADSASMIAEALMTKACVGLIELEPKKVNGKLHTSNHYLSSEGYLKNLNNIDTVERKKINHDQTLDQILDLLEL